MAVQHEFECVDRKSGSGICSRCDLMRELWDMIRHVVLRWPTAPCNSRAAARFEIAVFLR